MAAVIAGKRAPQTLCDELAALLDGGNAHMPFDKVMAEMPLDAANAKPPNFNYTPWQLLEHARRAQLDILNFIKYPDYKSPPYAEFWPDPEEVTTESKWRQTVDGFRDDLNEAVAMARNPETDFFSPLDHAPDYNIFREIVLIADHNAYHLGEFMALRRLLNVLPTENW